jgi:lipid-A-disaccharide synthase
MAADRPTIALVAGESSGDQLGAALVAGLREKYPQARFCGIGGKQMQASGVETWWDSEELAVMGLFEVMGHLPRLLRLRRELHRRLLNLNPDVFVGIDAPDFNLGLEIKLRRAAIRTVHYVSPTVWAWRAGRVRKIRRAANLVLCLFPFEPDFYARHRVPAAYVGHPMADQIEPDCDARAARVTLGLNPEATTVALLPGSRAGEVELLAEPMIGAAALMRKRQPGLQFVSAMANERAQAIFERALQGSDGAGVTLIQNRPRQVMAAADVVLCASGTATLETMLVNRPMVMTYRLARPTYLLAKHLKLIRPQHFALPNILAGESLVPELMQDEANAEALAREALRWLENPADREALRRRFDDLHERLRCSSGGGAAAAVAGLLNRDNAA